MLQSETVRRFSLLLLLACVSCQSEKTSSTSNQHPKDPLDAREYAYAFELQDLDKTPHSLRDFRGQLVLLNFWATWCAPCIAEMPALNELHEHFRDRGFQVVSISTDPARDEAKVREFVEKHSLSFLVLRDPEMSSIPEYGINGFPESFFISPEGKLLRVLDPKTKLQLLRIAKEREWNSEAYISLVADLLQRFEISGQPGEALLSPPSGEEKGPKTELKD